MTQLRVNAILLTVVILGISSCKRNDPALSNQLSEEINSLDTRLNTLENLPNFIDGLNDLAEHVEERERGRNRASCILNIRNIHQAVRAHQGLNGLNNSTPLEWKMIIGKNKYIEEIPQCPSGGTYTISPTIPLVGKVAASCSHSNDFDHQPESTEGW